MALELPENSANPAVASLFERMARITALHDAGAFLQWDQATMMPPGGAAARGNERAVLNGLAHEMLVAEETGDLLAAAESWRDEFLSQKQFGDGDFGWTLANLREIRAAYTRGRAVPRDLVEALSRAASTCEGLWRDARANADFSIVSNALSTLLNLVREDARIKGEALNLSPYDALLDEYEPGARISDVLTVFKELEDFLPAFIDDVIARQDQSPQSELPRGPFPRDGQKRLAREVMSRIGFDFRHGRLDESLHPFCSGTPTDVRLTTRYDDDEFVNALFGVIHETGHALYEQGLPVGWLSQPVGRARSMGFHESQSLLFEMQLGHSTAFLSAMLPVWREVLGGTGKDWEPESFARALNRVARTFIRIEADEVTYPVHIIVRTRLERAMVEGDLQVADLPGAWNDGMEGLLGIRPPNDALGCLQDIHWYDGDFGYFPTYTLGAMTAAQLYDAAGRSIPGLSDEIAAGNFGPLLGWLRTNVHQVASLREGPDLLQKATGRPLDARIFINHLKRRYLPA